LSETKTTLAVQHSSSLVHHGIPLSGHCRIKPEKSGLSIFVSGFIRQAPCPKFVLRQQERKDIVHFGITGALFVWDRGVSDLELNSNIPYL
jgi:hypothetical protein